MKTRFGNKIGLRSDPDNFKILYKDLKLKISKLPHAKWQQRWNNNIHNKLFQIQTTLGESRWAFQKSRTEQAIISRLCNGHTRLTPSFIMKQEKQPQYLACQSLCTVKHILMECKPFALTWKLFLKVISLTELFGNVEIEDVLSSLR